MNWQRYLPALGILGSLFILSATLYAQQGRVPAGPAPAPNNPANVGGTKKGPSRTIPVGTPGGAAGKAPAAGPQRPVDNGAPLAPKWFPLSSGDQDYVDQVLNVWEKTSGKIDRYRCNFTRWKYDAAFGPFMPAEGGLQGELLPQTRETGRICYKSPDKGMIKVEKIERCIPPKAVGQQETWTVVDNELGEHWVCDGKSVYSFDHPAKMLRQQVLPPELQGKAIADGPLPFFFGLNAQRIKSRFWIRPIAAPEGTEGEVWLEAQPKTRDDAANFKQVRIILDQKKVLPKALLMLEPDGNSHMNYVFTDCEKNWNEIIDKLKRPFEQEFYQPKTPANYRKVIDQLPGGDEPVQGPAPPPTGPQAKKPLQTKSR